MSEVLEFSESVGSNAAVNSHFGLIVDIAVALIFLLFAIWHARKGFYKTFAGIIAVVVAIAIGIIGAGYLTPPVMEKAWPKVEETVVENYDSSVGHTVAELHDLSLVLGRSVRDRRLHDAFLERDRLLRVRTIRPSRASRGEVSVLEKVDAGVRGNRRQGGGHQKCKFASFHRDPL